MAETANRKRWLNDYIFELFATTFDQIRLRIGAIPSKIVYFTETDCEPSAAKYSTHGRMGMHSGSPSPNGTSDNGCPFELDQRKKERRKTEKTDSGVMLSGNTRQ